MSWISFAVASSPPVGTQVTKKSADALSWTVVASDSARDSPGAVLAVAVSIAFAALVLGNHAGDVEHRLERCRRTREVELGREDVAAAASVSRPNKRRAFRGD